MCNGGIVKLANLLRRFALESDGAAIGGAGLLSVDWLGDAKGASFVPVEEPRVARTRLVSQRLASAKYAEYGVIKLF